VCRGYSLCQNPIEKPGKGYEQGITSSERRIKEEESK
jgi:hypothetical protein